MHGERMDHHVQIRWIMRYLCLSGWALSLALRITTYLDVWRLKLKEHLAQINRRLIIIYFPLHSFQTPRAWHRIFTESGVCSGRITFVAKFVATLKWSRRNDALLDNWEVRLLSRKDEEVPRVPLELRGYHRSESSYVKFHDNRVVPMPDCSTFGLSRSRLLYIAYVEVQKGHNTP